MPLVTQVVESPVVLNGQTLKVDLGGEEAQELPASQASPTATTHTVPPLVSFRDVSLLSSLHQFKWVHRIWRVFLGGYTWGGRFGKSKVVHGVIRAFQGGTMITFFLSCHTSLCLHAVSYKEHRFHSIVNWQYFPLCHISSYLIFFSHTCSCHCSLLNSYLQWYHIPLIHLHLPEGTAVQATLPCYGLKGLPRPVDWTTKWCGLVSLTAHHLSRPSSQHDPLMAVLS